jgi:ribosome-binding factor A
VFFKLPKQGDKIMSRHDKVQETLKREISIILHDELKDPRLGFTTITKVEMSKDLRYAKVFYSVLGQDTDHQKTKQALDSSLGYIRKLIAERVQLRFTPEIVFKEDRSSQYSFEIQKVLDEIKGLDKA